ncbi:cytochrome-c peroxidase [Luteimonas sp. A277]
MGKRWRIALMAGAVAAIVAGGVACTQGDSADDNARAQGGIADGAQDDIASEQGDIAADNASTQDDSAARNVSTQDGGAVDTLRQTASSLFGVIPDPPTEVSGRPVTTERVELGRMLFFEPRLSRSHVITCNTCHSIGTGGADNVPASVGHGWQRGPRNSPTVFNAVFNAAQFWDGRAADLAEQAGGPVQASVEMNSTPELVVETLSSIPQYVELFREAFPDSGGITFEDMTVALEAFETTLVTPGAPFDRWLEGDDSAMTATQVEGLQLFFETGCASCHNGVNFGGQSYFPFGVLERPGADILPEEDKGRFEVTATATDEYVFRASPLRNVELTAPYFHSGQVWSLEQAVAIMGTSQLGREISDEEAEKIAAFLRTLTGLQPEVVYPILPPSTTDTPSPER